MQTNETYGITVEDLEKAASVRLFEKAAAAEGINLAELSESQVEDLYSAYQQNSSEDNTPMNDELIDLFEKQAAYEGVDLEGLSDEELAYVFNNFVENISNEEEEVVSEEDEAEKLAAAESEAYEKLAEAEILGRHMARAYMDELEKEASYRESMMQGAKKAKDAVVGFASDARKGMNKNLKGAIGDVNEQISNVKKEIGDLEKMDVPGSDAGSKADKLKGLRDRLSTMETQRSTMERQRKRAKQAIGGGAAAGTVAVGGGAMAMKKRGQEKSASAQITDLAIDRANEFIEFGKEAGYDQSLLDDYALEILVNEGYDISPLFE